MTTRRHQPLLMILIVMTVLALALSACGRKGSPKPPEGRESAYTYPNPYPATNTVGPNESAQESKGPLWIFGGSEEEPDPDAEPDSVLILPPPEEDSRFSGQGAPSVVPKSRTKIRTY